MNRGWQLVCSERKIEFRATKQNDSAAIEATTATATTRQSAEAKD